MDKYYNNRILLKNFFEYLKTFIWQSQYIRADKRCDYLKKLLNVFFIECILLLYLSILFHTVTSPWQFIVILYLLIYYKINCKQFEELKTILLNSTIKL